MGNQEKEQKYGDMFEKSMLWQKTSNRRFRIIAGTTAAIGTANYFIVPDERLEYTGVPYVGALAILGANHLLNRFVDRAQDDAIALGTQDFNNDPPE